MSFDLYPLTTELTVKLEFSSTHSHSNKWNFVWGGEECGFKFSGFPENRFEEITSFPDGVIYAEVKYQPTL